LFKSFGIHAPQPWEREEKKAGSVDQEEDNSEWSQEMKERSRREPNIIIQGLKQDSEQEDGHRRKAHDVNQVVVIGKMKCPNLTEDNIREMIIQVRREGAYSKEHSSRPLKVVLKPEAREFRTRMPSPTESQCRAEDNHPGAGGRHPHSGREIPRLPEQGQAAEQRAKGKWVVVRGKGNPSIWRDRKYAVFHVLCGPRPQDVGHLCLRSCNFFNPFYNLNCSA
jgi:hypothetical protein